MKKFRFSLAKLKEYREKVLDSEKTTLSIMRRELVELEGELAALIELIDIKHDELRLEMLAGTTPLEISTRKRYITAKKQELYLKRVEIGEKEKQIEKQLRRVIEATQDVSVLEKLEESQLEEYRAAELKENEQFIEEFVTNADFRKKNQM